MKHVQEERIYYLDILRTMACILVIVIHSSSKYVVTDFGSFNFWVGNILDSLARVSVPIFIMISGALMLDKKYEFSNKKLIKHLLKMITFFAFWSALYCIIYSIIIPLSDGGKTIGLKKILENFIFGHYHLWYIYTIIGIYLIVPLLRLWVKDKNKKYVEYFIILSIIFTYLVPQIIYVGKIYSNWFVHLENTLEMKIQVQYIGGFTTYFILGWYINNYDIKHKKAMYILGILSFAVTLFGTYFLSVSKGRAIQMYENLSINVLSQSLIVFIFFKDKFINSKVKRSKIVSLISKYSLGIYAVHVIFIKGIYTILGKVSVDCALINIPIVIVVSLSLSLLCSFIFSKIPFLKKTV